jgi:hypothetical protein
MTQPVVGMIGLRLMGSVMSANQIRRQSAPRDQVVVATWPNPLEYSQTVRTGDIMFMLTRAGHA